LIGNYHSIVKLNMSSTLWFELDVELGTRRM